MYPSHIPNALTARILTVLLAICPIAGCGDDDNGGNFSTDIVHQQVATGDLVFDLRVAGSPQGEPVILLHGFPETSLEWRHQLEDLASSGYYAIAPDQRGYSAGARPDAVEQYNIALLALDVLNIADSLGLGRFHLVGHDWGAAVAWAVAGLTPDRVRSLSIFSIPHPDAFADALVDPESCQSRASSYFDLFTSDRAAQLLLNNDAAFLRSLFPGFPNEVVEEYVRVFSQPGAMQAALDWYNANVGEDQLTPQLGPVRVPTMFIWSDEDAAVCPEPVRATENFVDAPYELIVLQGVDHWIPERAPEETIQLLRRHLERW